MTWRAGHLDGLAVGMAMDNIDTDQLIPARFMSAPRSQGYGGFLLHDLRGAGFALDAPGAAGAQLLIAGRNFGCGSSREAAVYALVDAGFRAVVAPSFGDIFASNAVNNGLLPAVADTAALLTGALMAALPGPARVDLDGQTVTLAGQVLPFAIDPVWRLKLLNGWDDLDLTARHTDDIAAHAARVRQTAPWQWTDANQGPPRAARNPGRYG
jgi:3-isopropylmalate/(R)-2-methylmalate dehydratase small subunit